VKPIKLDASVIDERKFIPAAIWTKRLFAVGLIFMSLAGTYAAFNQTTWSVPDTSEELIVLSIALIYQIICSLVQFFFRSQWRSLWYLGALAASVVPSVFAYSQFAVNTLATTILEMGVPESWTIPLAWAALSIAMLGVDIIPEHILVSRRAKTARTSRASEGRTRQQAPGYYHEQMAYQQAPRYYQEQMPVYPHHSDQVPRYPQE